MAADNCKSALWNSSEAYCLAANLEMEDNHLLIVVLLSRKDSSKRVPV